MKFMIFDVYERDDGSVRRHSETNFEFLNRCSWKAVSQVRDLIELYLSHFPISEQNEIVSRIRSGTKNAFSSAIFELFLHEALLRQNFEITHHPFLGHTNYRPDFLVKCPSGIFYVEAVLASERNGSDPSGQLRIESTLDELRKFPHPNFYVFADYRGVPTTQPSAKRLGVAIGKWLDRLDPDANNIFREQMTWSHEDWELTLEAIPVKPERRGKTTHLVAGHSGEGGWSDAWTGIRDAIKYKASKYGELDGPLVVAVNYQSTALDEIDEIQALFGEEQFLFSLDKPDAEPRLTRAPNGAWHDKGGPSATRASGAWIFRGLHQYNAANCKQVIYANPWAKHDFPSCIKLFPCRELVGSQIVEISGQTFGEALGLESDWLDENDRS